MSWIIVSLLPELQTKSSKVSFFHEPTEFSPLAKTKHQSYNETTDLQRSSRFCDVLWSWDMASISCNPQENKFISWKEPNEEGGPTIVQLRQQWEASAAHKAVSVFDSSKDDLRLRPYQSWLEATTWPTEETLVWQSLRVLDDNKHQTGRRANTRHGPKQMEEAYVTLRWVAPGRRFKSSLE